MKKFVFVIITSLIPLFVMAAGKPSGLILPDAPEGNPNSDCEQALKDWNFPQQVIVSKTQEYLFLVIDRYGGKRDFPDYRGAMCRVKDMKEVWSVYELFPHLENIVFSDDGKYFVNAMGRVNCGSEEDMERVGKLDVITFHKNGEIIYGYKIDDFLPNWRKDCEEDGKVSWLSSRYDMTEAILEDNNTVFKVRTSDGNMHYFDIRTGKKTTKP